MGMYPPGNGGNMLEEGRKKGQHLTRDDRHEIQRGLREHRSFQEISMIIGCSPDT
ncbi:MAG: helix-turn-helix domain-containing protein, partial [Lachnospiraceae bacterium]|nr:helix-turn-helix domain-containing protein [Lachnospiraceae bacterium]